MANYTPTKYEHMRLRSIRALIVNGTQCSHATAYRIGRVFRSDNKARKMARAYQLKHLVPQWGHIESTYGQK